MLKHYHTKKLRVKLCFSSSYSPSFYVVFLIDSDNHNNNNNKKEKQKMIGYQKGQRKVLQNQKKVSLIFYLSPSPFAQKKNIILISFCCSFITFFFLLFFFAIILISFYYYYFLSTFSLGNIFLWEKKDIAK